MLKIINSPKKLVSIGASFLIIGIFVGIPLMIYILGKGEADRYYEPALLLKILSYLIGCMFYGGPVLIGAGILWGIVIRLKGSRN